MIAVEIKSGNHKFIWQVVGLPVHRAPNEDTRFSERLVARTRCTKNSAKRSVIGGDLNLPHVDWNGNTEGKNLTQALFNRLVWENGFSQVIKSPTRGDAILDVYLVRPENSYTSSSIVQRISDHHGVLLEIYWEENYTDPQPGRKIPIYNKTDILGLQTFLRDRFACWAINGSSIEQIWNNFKSKLATTIKTLSNLPVFPSFGFPLSPALTLFTKRSISFLKKAYFFFIFVIFLFLKIFPYFVTFVDFLLVLAIV